MGSPVKRLVKRAATALDSVRSTDGVVVLIYHRVGGRTGVSVDLPLGLFERQISYIAENCDVLTLDQLASEPRPQAAQSRRQVVVTFDDGTADFPELAVPVLVKYGVPATMYLATRFVDEGLMFPDDGEPMSWAAAKEALDSGVVSFGSHTHSHALLDRVSVSEAAEELDRSAELIGDNLGVPVAHFAYPKALLASAAVEPEVRKRFLTASIGRSRANRPGNTDLHRITRTPVQREDGMAWFERKVDGGMALENDVRDAVNRLRYRRAES